MMMIIVSRRTYVHTDTRMNESERTDGPVRRPPLPTRPNPPHPSSKHTSIYISSHHALSLSLSPPTFFPPLPAAAAAARPRRPPVVVAAAAACWRQRRVVVDPTSIVYVVPVVGLVVVVWMWGSGWGWAKKKCAWSRVLVLLVWWCVWCAGGRFDRFDSVRPIDPSMEMGRMEAPRPLHSILPDPSTPPNCACSRPQQISGQQVAVGRGWNNTTPMHHEGSTALSLVARSLRPHGLTGRPTTHRTSLHLPSIPIPPNHTLFTPTAAARQIRGIEEGGGRRPARHNGSGERCSSSGRFGMDAYGKARGSNACGHCCGFCPEGGSGHTHTEPATPRDRRATRA